MIEENDKPRSNLVEDYLKDVERARFFRKKDERGSVTFVQSEPELAQKWQN